MLIVSRQLCLLYRALYGAYDIGVCVCGSASRVSPQSCQSHESYGALYGAYAIVFLIEVFIEHRTVHVTIMYGASTTPTHSYAPYITATCICCRLEQSVYTVESILQCMRRSTSHQCVLLE